MDNDIALRAVIETAKGMNSGVPLDVVERCYRLLLSKQFEKDDGIVAKQFEDIINNHLQNEGK